MFELGFVPDPVADEYFCHVDAFLLVDGDGCGQLFAVLCCGYSVIQYVSTPGSAVQAFKSGKTDGSAIVVGSIGDGAVCGIDQCPSVSVVLTVRVSASLPPAKEPEKGFKRHFQAVCGHNGVLVYGFSVFFTAVPRRILNTGAAKEK